MDDPGSRRGKKGVSDVYLIVDTRERAVIPFIESELTEFSHVVGQVNTGDFLICRKTRVGDPKILACIERKTLKDFAASFKDGRYKNVNKMLTLRQTHGCALFFLVEGPAFPNPNRRFERIPYGNILAAITKLMVRDGVFVVQTENESHSAKRLADLMRVYETEIPYAAPAPALPLAGAGAGAADEDEDDDGGVVDGPLVVPEVLTGLVEETDADAAVSMWARLRGVSVVLGKILTREFSAVELATGKVSLDRIKKLRTATGRTINKDAVASLDAVRTGSEEHAVKLVSGLRNVTPAVAKLILEATGGLARLCSYPRAGLEMIQIPQKNRTIRLGKTRAGRILTILRFREGGAEPLPVGLPGHRLGSAAGNAAEDPLLDEYDAPEVPEALEDAYDPVSNEDMEEIFAGLGLE